VGHQEGAPLAFWLLVDELEHGPVLDGLKNAGYVRLTDIYLYLDADDAADGVLEEASPGRQVLRK